jgi:hypothetical protein
VNDISPADARSALDAVDRANARVKNEVGLPRWYWWLLAAAWLALGVLGDFGPQWLTVVATAMFALVHSTLASHLLGGRRRTDRLQISADTAGRRIPLVVIGMLVALVAVTIGAGFALHADGIRHAGTAAAAFAALLVGVGGPDIFGVLRRWARA